MPTLASYATHEADTRGRVHPEEEHEFRTCFMRDRDRIIYSTAFRRLEYKTQVFVNHEGDHYRTRLTHTLEVAQIARTIARALNLNEDLAEAIALAHDIGHTPFGHAGEEALNELMEKHGGSFEHNAHGLRVVDLLEERYEGFPGLNLSYELREAFVRHKTEYDKPTDTTEFPASEGVHLEGQVVCLADAVAYGSHDLDDGLEIGLLEEDALKDLAMWKNAAQTVGARDTQNSKTIRRKIVRELINMQVTDIIQTTQNNIEQAGIKTLSDVREQKSWLVAQSKELKIEKKEFQDFLYEHLYRNYRVMRTSIKAQRFLTDMFNELLSHTNLLPGANQNLIERDGTAQVICDYIAGMTDRYAQDAYKNIFYPFERM